MTPEGTLDALRRHMLVDGFDIVIDLRRSRGSVLVDARSGVEYLDLLTFFGSLPLGMNHPRMADDERFMAELARAALHKVANADLYTAECARFVEVFARVLGDPALPHLFFIDGGALAVENALKVAFDWKARRIGATTGDGLSVLHLVGAFHGRSGYTLSLTNAGDSAVTELFPAWDWPRVPAPSDGMVAAAPWPTEPAVATTEVLRLAEHIFERDGARIACFIAEPVQGAGGDVHLGARFLQGMQQLCVRNDALFILDEVQTGCGLSGTPWVYQQLGLAPDVVAFGKKTQVCGVMAGRRVDLVPDNALAVSSRIGSTWAGNLVDMVRATRVLEIIDEEELIPAAAAKGAWLIDALCVLARRHPDMVGNVRGRGLICALDLPDGPTRQKVLRRLREREHVLLLPGGERSIRFRPSLAVSVDDLRRAVGALGRVLDTLGSDDAN
ncbi:L-lysine 6-transaminase [Micromonospora sp. NPDC051227]|uniref:L-lysine 6-transaminase n=1 Tax=Micromonospora sp. NPDC051227 TaxID=3364285 RepID=UPI0037B38755